MIFRKSSLDSRRRLDWVNSFLILLSRLATCRHVSRKCSATISHALLIISANDAKSRGNKKCVGLPCALLLLHEEKHSDVIVRFYFTPISSWVPSQSTHVHAPRPNTANTCRCALSSRTLCGYWSDLSSRNYSRGIFGAPKFMDVSRRRRSSRRYRFFFAVLSISHIT